MSVVLVTKPPVLKTPKVFIPKTKVFIPKTPKAPKVLRQQFFATCTDTGISVKFSDITFGIRKNADKYDTVITGLPSNGDSGYITLCISILRKKIKSGMTFENIVSELNTLGGTATSIRIFHGHICEQVAKVKKIRETIERKLVYVTPANIKDMKKALISLRSHSKQEYILFEKNIYHYPRKSMLDTDATKTSFKERDMVD